MFTPKMPKSTRVRGRINNANNPLRARMWHSRQSASAWFVTVFRPFSTAISAERLLFFFPDASYILVAYCLQDVVHAHIVITMCNVYARETVLGKIKEAFGLSGRRFAKGNKVEICPIYDSVNAAVKYVSNQLVDEQDALSQVIIGDPCLMGSYGNAWEREYTGDRGAGVTERKLTAWCMQGFPVYAVNAPPLVQSAAMRSTVAFNKLHERMHYNRRVKVIHARNGDGTEPIYDCCDYLVQFFGSKRAATPFVYDIRGLLCPFTRDPFPGYLGQPGIVLLVSDDYLNKPCERETVNGLQARKGAYGNLEVIFVVRL